MSNKLPVFAFLVGDPRHQYSERLLHNLNLCMADVNALSVYLLRSGSPNDPANALNLNSDLNYQTQFSSIYKFAPITKPDVLVIAYGSLKIAKHMPQLSDILSLYSDIPLLIIEDPSPSEDIPYVISDNYNGMKECITHLIEEHGYTKIAFLAGPVTSHGSNERLKAYRDAMSEHGLSLDDNMIEYGDFTKYVDEQVNRLLDNNPNLDAIASANDDMAKTIYRICNKRNIVIGSDLAITGFDNSDSSKQLSPSLTSVANNDINFTRVIIEKAVELYQGKKVQSAKIPAVPHFRESCGCKKIKILSSNNILDITASIINNFFDNLVSCSDEKKLQIALDNYIKFVYEYVFAYDDLKNYSNQQLIPLLQEICEIKFISNQQLLEDMTNFLDSMQLSLTDHSHKLILNIISSYTQQFLCTHEINITKSNNIDALQKIWFASTFTKDIITHNYSRQQNMTTILERLKAEGVTSTYIFLHKDYEIINDSTELSTYDKLYLTGYYNENEFKVYPKKSRPAVTLENGIVDFLPRDKPHAYTSYILFSGEIQYGIMLCEVPFENIDFATACALELGTLLHTLSIRRNEHKTRKELQKSLTILNNISAYDELTKIYNRRGFMEHAIKLIDKNRNQNACILFADLDHLKEINDSFGHNAGDYAIKTASNYLSTVLPSKSVIGRIGGDEFVAIVPLTADQSANDIKSKLNAYAQKENSNPDIPYYIELSVGFYEFSCDKNINISELLKRSDSLLYSEKSKRRISIKK